MKIPTEVLEALYPDIERVIELVVGAFGGKAIPNGAIIIGLGAVIGLTLNEAIPVMPGTDKPEAPEIGEILPFLEAGMEMGRTLEVSRVK